MTDNTDDFVKETAAPVGVGLLTIFVAHFLLPISKKLSIFPRLRNEILGGLVDGIGNVRNLVATIIGTGAMFGTFLILNKRESESPSTQPSPEDVHMSANDAVEVNGSKDSWEEKMAARRQQAVPHR